MSIPYRYRIETLSINGNGKGNVKRRRKGHRHEKEKENFETSAFASLQRALRAEKGLRRKELDSMRFRTSSRARE